MLKGIKKKLKPQINFLKNVLYDLQDLRDKITGKREEMVPPRRMVFVGAGDYKKIGEHFKKVFIEVGGLKPTDHVLDVGSGIGRMARPLTGYLSPQSRYEGFDIVKEGVDWSTKHITSKFPHFHFQHADVYNLRYNTGGKVQPEKYVFPYGDNSFDFIFLTSVFTHMMPDEMERYMSEIHRVLKPGGTCLITFFLLNEKSRELIASGKSVFKFPFKFNDNCYYDEEEIPESAVAYNEEYIRHCYLRYELKIQEPIHFGAWSGRENTLSFQDVVVARK